MSNQQTTSEPEMCTHSGFNCVAYADAASGKKKLCAVHMLKQQLTSAVPGPCYDGTMPPYRGLPKTFETPWETP